MELFTHGLNNLVVFFVGHTVSNHMNDFLYNRWNHLLTNQNLECYANVIHDKGAAITNCFFFALSNCLRSLTTQKFTN